MMLELEDIGEAERRYTKIDSSHLVLCAIWSALTLFMGYDAIVLNQGHPEMLVVPVLYGVIAIMEWGIFHESRRQTHIILASMKRLNREKEKLNDLRLRTMTIPRTGAISTSIH